MSRTRKVIKSWKSVPTIEGAGVHLKRAFGFRESPELDPFLLLDDFHSANPSDYLPGFPWHPHRGIETITYVLQGNISHGDSMGNKGIIGAGDVQWMTAGSGIIHQEMPEGEADGRLWGLQLWTNLPRSHKMIAPRYREIKADVIPDAVLDSGARIKVICGTVDEIRGPVQDIIAEPEYLDITLPPRSSVHHRVKDGYTVVAYMLAGSARFVEKPERPLSAVNTSVSHGQYGQARAVYGSENVVLFDREGDEIIAATDNDEARFILVAGKPIGEPVAWSGPIVMNTEEELRIAFQEYREGTFVKR